MSNPWRGWILERMTACLDAREGVIAEVQLEKRQVLSVQSLNWKDEGLVGLYAVVRLVFYEEGFIYDLIEQEVFLGRDFQEEGPLAHPGLVEDGFAAFCAACAHNMKRGERMPADIITYEELGFTLTRLVETWVRQGPPEPVVLPATRPPVELEQLSEEVLLSKGDLFTHGFSIAKYTILLSTFHYGGLWLVDTAGTTCTVVERADVPYFDEVGDFATAENPLKVQAFALWLVESLRKSGLGNLPIVEEDDDYFDEVEEPSEVTLSQWLMFNHRKWLDVDRRIQPGFVGYLGGTTPHPLFEAFVGEYVLK